MGRLAVTERLQCFLVLLTAKLDHFVAGLIERNRVRRLSLYGAEHEVDLLVGPENITDQVGVEGSLNVIPQVERFLLERLGGGVIGRLGKGDSFPFALDNAIERPMPTTSAGFLGFRASTLDWVDVAPLPLGAGAIALLQVRVQNVDVCTIILTHLTIR